MTQSTPMASDNETTPLAASHYDTYAAPENTDSRSARAASLYTEDDAASKYSQAIAERLVKFSKKRFWWFCGVGVLAVVVLQLSFLPRTSLSRDYRRWNGLKMTKNDVKRSFIWHSGLESNLDRIDTLLWNFTKINEKSPFSLVSEDNLQLTNFVETKFKQLGFKTSVHTVDFPDLRKPITAHLRLVDTKKDAVVYDADLNEPGFKTPAFFGFGASDGVRADFVYVNEGAAKDYQLLADSKIDVARKIVIVRSKHDSNVTVAQKLGLAELKGAAGLIHYYDYSSLISNNKENETFLNNVIRRESVALNFGGALQGILSPSISSLPASYKALKPILDTMAVSINKPFHDWDYYPENLAKDFKIQMVTEFEEPTSRKLSNIIGTIDGIIKDGEVVIGAARDSFSSSNPLSSQVILLEIMRHFQTLVRSGWKPLRNIKFVSWDASRNQLVGSKAYIDNPAFRNNMLAYINIESDTVRGSRFKVDATPALNHVIRKVAKAIPMPKDSVPYRTLATNDDDDDDDDDDHLTTLFHYWKKQDNNSIDNDLGSSVYDTDAMPFQYHMSTPIVNVKFENDPKRDSSIYTPNSNYFSYNWLKKRQIDDQFVLHSALIRYLGMLLISVSEHEVVSFRAADYFDWALSRFEGFSSQNRDIIHNWSSKEVPKYLLKSNLLSDIKGDTITFGIVFQTFRRLLIRTTKAATIFDIYNGYIQEGLIQDYPWYHIFKKIKLWAQFKVANYRLLHFEKDLTLSHVEGVGPSWYPWYNHLFYGMPSNDLEADSPPSPFHALYDSVRKDNVEQATLWIATAYEKLKALDKKMA